MTSYTRYLKSFLFVGCFSFFSIVVDALDDAKRVLVVGGATCDVFIKGNKDDVGFLDLKIANKEQEYILIKDGIKIDIGDSKIYTGGGATNAAVSFSRQGVAANIYCRLGQDYWAKFVKEALKKDNVDTSRIAYDDSDSTGISFIIPTPHDRSLFVLRGANTKIKKEDFPFDILEHVDGVFITALSCSSAGLFGPLVEKAHEKHILVATNPGSAQLKSGAACIAASLPKVDVLILNSTEAELLLNTLVKEKYLSLSDLVLQDFKNVSTEKGPELISGAMFEIGNSEVYLSSFFKAVMKLGPKIIVVTNGKDGAYVGVNNVIYHCPIVPATVIDTLGAGDAFGSTFVSQYLQGKSIDQAMQMATINSASVIEFDDAKTGLLKTVELEKRLLKFSPIVQVFAY